ncbi:MAG: hypothetical protein M3310_02645 [Actinomycetota bacterium]|nr:hypothetical protein [Actinomycetota bacterium]
MRQAPRHNLEHRAYVVDSREPHEFAAEPGRSKRDGAARRPKLQRCGRAPRLVVKGGAVTGGRPDPADVHCAVSCAEIVDPLCDHAVLDDRAHSESCRERRRSHRYSEGDESE